MKSKRFAGRGSGRPLRPMDWYCGQTWGDIVNACSSNWLILPSDVQDKLTDPTLMATRAWGGMRTSNTQITNGGFAGIGLIAWSYASDDPPVGSSCPGVITDCDLDWIARWVGTLPSGQPGGVLLDQVVFDLAHSVRSRRRLGNDRAILIAVEGFQLSGSVSYAFDFRCLLKE